MSMNSPAAETPVYLALELSCSSWLAAVRLPDRDKIVLHRIEAGDTTALLTFVETQRAQAQAQARAGVAVDVVSCFEAGRDGFWLHRLLRANGVINHVVEPTSILVNRRARRAKTDRLDAQGLLRVLAGAPSGRSPDLQCPSCPYARRGGRQAPTPRTRASRAGTGPDREPHRGAPGHPRHPEAAVPALLGR